MTTDIYWYLNWKGERLFYIPNGWETLSELKTTLFIATPPTLPLVFKRSGNIRTGKCKKKTSTTRRRKKLSKGIRFKQSGENSNLVLVVWNMKCDLLTSCLISFLLSCSEFLCSFIQSLCLSKEPFHVPSLRAEATFIFTAPIFKSKCFWQFLQHLEQDCRCCGCSSWGKWSI